MNKAHRILFGGILLGMAWTQAWAAPTNDNFVDRTLLAGTNITYTGDFTLATMEPGEPTNGATNTVWISWAAPASGYVQVNMASAPQYQYYGIYTGPSLSQLQPVNLVPLGLNSIYRFLVSEGTVYHFQFSGGADVFTFYLQFQTLTASPNDNFSNATDFSYGAVDNATTELGEPAHMGNIPQKSIWWKFLAPYWGTYNVNPAPSLASDFVLAAYTGDSVEALTLVAKATNGLLSFSVAAGQLYHIAGVVPTNAIGDIFNYTGYGQKDVSEHIVPGNLLLEPSWEGTKLNPVHWGKAGGVGGYVNALGGGVDGATWPAFGKNSGGQGRIWQDFGTIPGHQYAIRFADFIGGQLSSGSTNDAQIGVVWDTNLVAIAVLPGPETGVWHWNNYTAIASNMTTRIMFTNMARNVELDAFSVVDMSSPPAIVNQPSSVSSVAGGMASFIVGTTGSSPLAYQWFFNESPLDGQTGKILTLDALTAEQAGNYRVTVTNSFGAVTSSVASLNVGDPVSATILSQPYGDTVSVGGYFNFSVVAGGTTPLTYQWFLNDQAITGATNSSLTLTNVQPADAGKYTMQVENQSTVAWSLPATLIVSVTDLGGGTINFRNKNSLSGITNIIAPVFYLDGLTPLSGSKYVAQLYAGPSLDQLRPAGLPTPFQDGFNAGYFVPQIITLANVMPGSNAVLQVCVWDASYGNSYEQARAYGGSFGKSGLLSLPVGGGDLPPQILQGLQSFNLQAGLPYFEVGTISFVQWEPPNTIIWSLQGQPGSIYLIEKSEQSEEIVWHPFVVLTNVTGTVTFTDTANSGDAAVLYRARILD